MLHYLDDNLENKGKMGSFGSQGTITNCIAIIVPKCRHSNRLRSLKLVPSLTFIRGMCSSSYALISAALAGEVSRNPGAVVERH